jgi:hypothetical protein
MLGQNMTVHFGLIIQTGQNRIKRMISNFISKISESSLLQTFNCTTDVVESAELFGLFHQKSVANRKKIKLLKDCIGFKNVFIVSNLSTYHNVHSSISGKKIINISDEEFLNSKFNFNDSLVILTNNNLAQIGPVEFSKFIEKFDSCIVAIHDFDNHHWHQLSIICALLADVYIPAHLSSNIIQSRINPNIEFSLPCGSIQWRRELLFDNLEKILQIRRNTQPLGMHNFYSKFKYRNSVISTLSKNTPNIRLNAENFHIRSADDRFNEWISHSCHWIIPVYNDLPIRFFDALITGGIPIIPNSLVNQMDYYNIPPYFYVTHDALDILNPSDVIERANELFISRSKEGILERFEYCIEKFHANSIVNTIIKHCEKKFLL